MPEWLAEITSQVCKEIGITCMPNCCNANLYERDYDCVGWCADDEPLFRAKTDDALIVSLSLGAAGIIRFRLQDTKEVVAEMMSLNKRDICTMEGLMQKYYQHNVPPGRSDEEGTRSLLPRINLTWRWIVAHNQVCAFAQRSPPKPVPTDLAVALRSLLSKHTQPDSRP